MIEGGDGFIRTPDFQPALAQAGKSLRRGNLVDQVQVNVQHRRAIRLLCHHMAEPYLLEKRSRISGSSR